MKQTKIKIKIYTKLSLALLVLALLLNSSCSNSLTNKSVVFADDFSGDMSNWWVEGAEEVYVKDGRMYINANKTDKVRNKACTVWGKEKIKGKKVIIDFDAYVIDSKTKVNNLNFFLHYTHPEDNIYTTRDERVDGAYGKYHDLNGYIFTYVNDVAGESEMIDGVPQGRFRIRRCPGFELLSTEYKLDGRKGVKRHIEIAKDGNRLTYKVDGELMCEAIDTTGAYNEGYFAFRTFMTHLWIDNFRVRVLD